MIKGDSNRWREHFNSNKLALCRWTKDVHLKENGGVSNAFERDYDKVISNQLANETFVR